MNIYALLFLALSCFSALEAAAPDPAKISSKSAQRKRNKARKAAAAAAAANGGGSVSTVASKGGGGGGGATAAELAALAKAMADTKLADSGKTDSKDSSLGVASRTIGTSGGSAAVGATASSGGSGGGMTASGPQDGKDPSSDDQFNVMNMQFGLRAMMVSILQNQGFPFLGMTRFAPKGVPDEEWGIAANSHINGVMSEWICQWRRFETIPLPELGPISFVKVLNSGLIVASDNKNSVFYNDSKGPGKKKLLIKSPFTNVCEFVDVEGVTNIMAFTPNTNQVLVAPLDTKDPIHAIETNARYVTFNGLRDVEQSDEDGTVTLKLGDHYSITYPSKDWKARGDQSVSASEMQKMPDSGKIQNLPTIPLKALVYTVCRQHNLLSYHIFNPREMKANSPDFGELDLGVISYNCIGGGNGVVYLYDIGQIPPMVAKTKLDARTATPGGPAMVGTAAASK